MQSRMEKYNSNIPEAKTRTQKNQSLYEDMKYSALTDFDVNSNVSVIDEGAKTVDVEKVRQMLRERYNLDTPKRKSIEIPIIDEPVIEENIVDTKEYDINAILTKAKQGKNVDYNKERLKKVRDAQYEILTNLDLELKKVEEPSLERKQEEDNLMNLINTITELEIKNRKKETKEALDLLNDLQGNDEEVTAPMHPNNEESQEKTEEKEQVIAIAKPDRTKEKEMEETMRKLEVNPSDYEDFSDINGRDTSSIIIKVIIFIIVIALVIGAVYIIDKFLELGLF